MKLRHASVARSTPAGTDHPLLIQRLAGRPGAATSSVGDDSSLASLDDPSICTSWWSLAEAAHDRNPFAEPWAALPALKCFGKSGPRVQVFQAMDGQGELLGIVPLAPTRFTLGRLWTVWPHVHWLDTTPLARPGHVEEFCRQLFHWLHQRGAQLLRWPALPLGTHFAGQLFEFLDSTERPLFLMREKDRPILRVRDLRAQKYSEQLLPKRRRRELQRLQRRLAELGKLEFRAFNAEDELENWMEAFLRMEANGWKGAAGTAIRCHPAEEAFFRSALRNGSRRGSVEWNALQLDDNPIAININFICGGGMWGFRTTYDERYARYAPGVVATFREACAALERTDIDWVDPCNPGDNELFAKLYPHRHPVADVIIGVHPGVRRHFSAVHAGYRFSKLARRAASAAFRKLGRTSELAGGLARSSGIVGARNAPVADQARVIG